MNNNAAIDQSSGSAKAGRILRRRWQKAAALNQWSQVITIFESVAGSILSDRDLLWYARACIRQKNHPSLQRACEIQVATLSMGDPVMIPAHTFVTLTQALGGNYTVVYNGNMVRVDGTDFREGLDLDADTFYEYWTPDGAPKITTSQPSPGAFIEAYEHLVAAGSTQILSVHMGAALSGTLMSSAWPSWDGIGTIGPGSRKSATVASSTGSPGIDSARAQTNGKSPTPSTGNGSTPK